eukprot:m.720700 g.720700  ORF g.720700 m.720700 type:complete len:263 (-) comp23007_c0_seq3:927-1715(-)
MRRLHANMEAVLDVEYTIKNMVTGKSVAIETLKNVKEFAKNMEKRKLLLEKQKDSFDSSTLIVLDSAELQFNHVSYFVPPTMTTSTFLKFVAEQNVKRDSGSAQPLSLRAVCLRLQQSDPTTAIIVGMPAKHNINTTKYMYRSWDKMVYVYVSLANKADRKVYFEKALEEERSKLVAMYIKECQKRRTSVQQPTVYLATIQASFESFVPYIKYYRGRDASKKLYHVNKGTTVMQDTSHRSCLVLNTISLLCLRKTMRLLYCI